MRRAITRVMVSVLGVVCVTVALVGLAQADGTGPHRDRDHHARFKVLGPDQQWVLDKTTGLRWQKTPGIPPENTKTYTWTNAAGDPINYIPDACNVLGDGARLPEVNELLSLVDYSVVGSSMPNIPVLPAGNPFVNVQASDYWSATSQAADAKRAWRVGFRTGGSGQDNKIPTDPSDPQSLDLNLVWCVR
jgi:hypothetical protein